MSKLVAAINQNTVKLETSSTVTFLERETISKLHKVFYNNEKKFYDLHTHNPNSSLGCITSGGTIANITGLWAARNNALPPTKDFGGIEKEGLFKALKYYGYQDAVVIGYFFFFFYCLFVYLFI